jgi:NAD(P)-dependent dehydrogenase (short-subunit alcohol dehydrogenase family)
VQQAGRTVTGVLDGKGAIITGAGTGLGAATARAFAAEGATVTLVGRREEKLRETAASVETIGGKAIVVPGDVAVEETAERAVTASDGVDVLVNNAGIHAHPYLVHETPTDEWDAFMAIDLRGPFLFTRAALPSMMARGGGSVINVSSMVALVGFKYGAAYSAAKAGLIALTRTTAIEYGDKGIRANCVCPGAMEPVEHADLDDAGYAKMGEAVAAAGGLPIARFAQVDEVAQLLVFLAGPNSVSMTGSIIPFDGGFTAK